jgi:hypothetical protein
LPVKANTRVGINAALALLLLWLYGGDVLDVLRATGSEAAALAALPSLPFAAIALLGMLLGSGLTVQGALGRRDASWRGYRVMPIVAVVVLFVDLFVLASGRPTVASNARAVAALDGFEQHASELSKPNAVPADAHTLEPVVKALGPTPWLRRGEVVPEWTLKVFTGCQAPRTDAAGEVAGTLLYCVNEPRTLAWITLVGLPFDQRFGSPALVTQGGAPLVGVVRVAPKDEANPSEPSFTVESDAGTLLTP